MSYTVRCYTGSGLTGPLGDTGSSGFQVPFASCDLVARAEHPLLAISDVSLDGGFKVPTWELLGVTALNEELARGLSPEELSLSQQFDCGDVSANHVMQLLEDRSVRVLLPPGWLHGTNDVSITTVTVSLRNPGPVRSHWSISMPFEKDVDVEPWVQPVWPPSRLEQVQSQFDISPKSGELGPGEMQAVTVRFHNREEGRFTLPVLLSLDHGRLVRLELVGQTVGPEAARLLVDDSKEVQLHVLEPQPIGHLDPPLQPLVLYNGGPTAVDVTLDLKDLERLNQEAYGFSVLSLATPDRLRIEPGGCAVSYWRFNPIEADRSYEAEVGVRVASGTGGESTSYRYRLCGFGFDPEGDRAAEAMQTRGTYAASGAEVPHATEARPPGQLVSAAHEVLDIGPVALGRPAQGVLAVTCSASTDLPVDIEFDVGGAVDSDLTAVEVEIAPPRTQLEPGMTKLFKVKLGAHDTPLLLQRNIRLMARPHVEHHDRRMTQETIDSHVPEVEEDFLPVQTELVQIELRARIGPVQRAYPNLQVAHRQAINEWGTGKFFPDAAGPGVAADVILLLEEALADLSTDPAVYLAAAEGVKLQKEGREVHVPTLDDLAAAQDGSAAAPDGRAQTVAESSLYKALGIEVEAFVEYVLEAAASSLLAEAAAVGIPPAAAEAQ